MKFILIFVALLIPAFAGGIEYSPIVGAGQENLSVEVGNYIAGSDKKFKFLPNIAGVLRVGVSAFGYSIGYSFRGSEKETDPSKAKTTMTEIQLGYNNENWGVDGSYQTYKGFYTEGTNVAQNYPELDVRHYGVISRYALNESEFSTGGLLDQSYAVKQSAHKFYLVGGVSQDELNSDISLMQMENAGVDPGLEDLRKLKSFIVKLGAGAGKYWVGDYGFFAGGLMDALVSYANYEFDSTTGKSYVSDSTMSFNIKLGAGYSGEKYKSGISIASDITNLKTPGRGQISPASNRLLIYFRWLSDF